MIKQTLNQLVKQVNPLRLQQAESESTKEAAQAAEAVQPAAVAAAAAAVGADVENLVCPAGGTKYDVEGLMYYMTLGAMSCKDVTAGAKPASEGNVAGEMQDGALSTMTWCFKADGVTPATIGVGSGGLEYAIKDLCPKACGVCATVPTKDTSDADMRAVTGGGTCAAMAGMCATSLQMAWMCPKTCGGFDECGHHEYVFAQQDCMAYAASYGQTIEECEADIPNWTKDADGNCYYGCAWQAMTEKECPPPTPLTCEEKQSCLSPPPPPLAPAWSGVCSEISTKEDCDEAASSRRSSRRRRRRR